MRTFMEQLALHYTEHLLPPRNAEQKKMLMRAFAPFDEKVTAAYLTGSEHIIVTTVKDGAEKEYSFDLAEGKFAVKERK